MKQGRSRAVAEFEYKGRPIHAMPGLHETVAEYASKFHSAGARCLDLGAGSGALSERLTDIGFEVVACDKDVSRLGNESRFAVEKFDIEHDWSPLAGLRFKLIVAVEVIEHLENPRQLIRKCKDYLEPDGRIIITTPNIDNPVSIASFILDGTFLWFSDGDHDASGHISPVSEWYLRKAVQDADLEFAYTNTIGDPYGHIAQWRWWKWRMKRLKLLGKLIEHGCRMDSRRRGEFVVAVLRHATR